MEGSKRGSILSYVALIAILTLFALETKAFVGRKLVSDLALDRSDDPRIRLNFNITMMDLICDWAVVDVVSAFGANQNVTAHVTKWDVDSEGVRKGYNGRNRDQKDIDRHDRSVTETIDELHENGVQVISLDEETLPFAKNEFDFLFVMFYADWCPRCREMFASWEKLAELMEDVLPDDNTDAESDAATKLTRPVAIAKVNCPQNEDLCFQQEGDIRGYPTVRLYVDGQRWTGGDYTGQRTVLEMVEWLYFVEEQTETDESSRQLHLAHKAARERLTEGEAHKEERKWHDKILMNKKRLHHEWKHEAHPGCQIAGHLLLDRAPGNFQIQARSQHHGLISRMTNLSHMINELYVGDPTAKHWIEQKRSVVPDGMAISPLDGKAYPTFDFHASYHHYLKLVPTKVEGMKVETHELRSYQMLASSEVAVYHNDAIPEVKFVYDLSPIAVSYSFRSRNWYDYVTSIFAIVGGVFTVVGMIEASISAAVSTILRRR